MGEACVELFRILYLCDKQDQLIRPGRHGLDHKRYIVHFKSEFLKCLQHHLPEQCSCLFTAVSQLRQLDLTFLKISPGQCAADLIFIDFLNLHLVAPLRFHLCRWSVRTEQSRRNSAAEAAAGPGGIQPGRNGSRLALTVSRFPAVLYSKLDGSTSILIGCSFQISSTYCWIVRSEVNLPEDAILRMAIFAQRFSSW